MLNSDWAAALLGYLLEAGINPKIIHWGIQSADDLNSCSLTLYQGNATASSELQEVLSAQVKAGRAVMSFLDDSLSQSMGLQITQIAAPQIRSANASVFAPEQGPLFYYDLKNDKNRNASCTSFIQSGEHTVGFQCKIGSGHFYHIGSAFYERLNSDRYAETKDTPARLAPLLQVLEDLRINQIFRWQSPGSGLVAFARTNPEQSRLWITVKNSRLETVANRLLIQEAKPKTDYSVSRPFGSRLKERISGEQLKTVGLPINLPSQESTVFVLDEIRPQGH